MVIHILAPASGKITCFDTTQVEQLPGVVSVHHSEVPGSLVNDLRTDHWGSLLGYVLIKEPNPDRIDDIFCSVAEAVDLLIKRLPVSMASYERVQGRSADIVDQSSLNRNFLSMHRETRHPYKVE